MSHRDSQHPEQRSEALERFVIERGPIRSRGIDTPPVETARAAGPPTSSSWKDAQYHRQAAPKDSQAQPQTFRACHEEVMGEPTESGQGGQLTESELPRPQRW